jgi:glycosyltransferase involved in cell wall biosynthesis
MFSVVLCTYNRADRVAGAVRPVLDQSWKDFELIVVDDGSTDRTAEVLAGIDDPRLRVVHRPNGGLSAARNTGITQAAGRLVAFLDDDDLVSPGWLAGLASRVGASTGFVSCTCRLVSPDRASVEEVRAFPDTLFPDVEGVFMAGTFAIDRSVLAAIGGYAEEIRVSHQTELLLRAMPELKRRGLTASLIAEPLIEIERREPGDRPLSQPADLLHGVEYLVDHHGEALARCRQALAHYYAIAGASAAQLGNRPLSRRYMLRAARAWPWNPKHLARAAVSLVPPLARRTWPVPT